MNILDLPKPYRDALAAFNALRCCGFSADDIYFQLNGQHPPYQVVVMLKAQGRDFNIVTGFLPGTTDEIERQWAEIASAVNEGRVPQEELDEIWQDWQLRHSATELLVALMNKGIALPGAGEN